LAVSLFSLGVKMVELEIANNLEEELVGVTEPEIELTIEEVIVLRMSELLDEGQDIVTIDYARIKEVYDSIIGMNTVKKLTMVPNLEAILVKVINMFDEEVKSTSSSTNFIRIAKSLFSNTEVDYFKIVKSIE
jgi:hypothetical protein